MYYILAVESNITSWASIVIEVIIALAAIFGGAGFWQYKQTQLQAKLDKESKETGLEKKVDTVIDTVSTLDHKVDNQTNEIKEIKEDIILLQKANTETVKYREARELRDESDLIAQRAIIDSLTGILRERLLENYNRCIKKGYYTLQEREIYKEMFRCYTQAPFNGNGVIHELQPIMQALPYTAEEAGQLHDEDSED